jgi:mevalonyl-CoA ligase
MRRATKHHFQGKILDSIIMLSTESGQPLHKHLSTAMPGTLSLVSGSKTPALWYKTLSEVVGEQADRYESQIAVSFPWQNVSLSYRQLHEESIIISKALSSCGLRQGDRVAIIAGNCFQYITAFLGSARVGCPFVVLNNTYTPKELVNALSASSCRLLFLARNIGSESLSNHFDSILNGAPMLSNLECIITLDQLHVQRDTRYEILPYPDFLKTASTKDQGTLQSAISRVQPTDTLNLQFTSGTTGSPKASMLTHNNLINNGRFVGDMMQLTPRDVVVCPPPLFHCFGLVLGFLASFTHGSEIVFPSDKFQADLALDSVYHKRCTALLSVPTMFVAILEANRRKQYPINTIRTGLAAGASVPAHLMTQLKVELGVPSMLIAYGMTETSPVTFITSSTDSEEQRIKTVGKVMPHTGAKVVDSKGKIVPRGTPGELCTSGYALQKGYWNNQAKTDEAMQRDAEGVLWMSTGDECVIDEAGYCRVTGRIKDIIIRGTYDCNVPC